MAYFARTRDDDMGWFGRQGGSGRRWLGRTSCIGAAVQLVVLVIAGTPGCQAPQQKVVLSNEEIRRMPLEPNIVRVAAYYPPYDPWIWNETRTHVRGIVISALYLEGPDVLGVFGDGIIRPRLYVLSGSGKEAGEPQLVREWSFDPEQAMPYRSRKRTLLGFGYRFHLLWGDELDLSGKDIRVVIVFERRDGMLIYSGKKDFRVPRGGSES